MRFRKPQNISTFSLTRQHKLKQLWKDILESVSGTEMDFTSGSLSRAILILSIPMVLEMVMESVFAVADIFFVSKLGADAVAIVGITESFMTVIYALAVGLSAATTALVSRRIGEKNKNGAAIAAVQAVIVGMIISISIAIPGIIYAEDLLKLMGVSHEMAGEGYMYPLIMLGGNFVIMLLFIMNAIFRSAGDAAISMRVLWMANLINIILDPCLIFGLGPFPELGLMGAAVATNIGRGIAVLYQLYLLLFGNKRVSVGIRHLKVNIKVMRKLIRLSLGGIGQHIIATSSWIILVRIISEFGSVVVAAYTIAIRVIIFSILPSWGLSNAAATLVGQNLGAEQPKRAERSVIMTSWVNIIFLGSIAVLFISYPSFFIRLFIDDPEVIRIGSIGLRIISYGYISYGLGMVMNQTFNGAGDTTTPTLINFVCFWLLEIPLAYLLALYFKIGPNGVFISIVIAESILSIMAFIIFKKGRWKLKTV